MKKQFLPLLSVFLCFPFCLSAQIQFQKSAGLLAPAQCYSGSAIAVLDMNGDGLDDIARLNQGTLLSVELQTAPGQPFTHIPVGAVSTDSQWGMCAADVDNNGFPDVLCGGEYDGIQVAMANADGTSYSFVTLNAPGTFVQGVNFADINNDGWLDAFVCHDDGAARIFGNDGAGNLVYQPLWIDLATVPPSDNSGNYGSVWSDVDNDGDLDLYIAHCRQGVDDPTDPRRINQLFLNNGDGTFTQDVTNASGLRIGAQSWTADFGDIDNDGDFDCFITNHDVSSQLLENDGSGHFTDISVQAGIFNAVGGLPIQGIFRDFDNDGFVDILVAGTNDYLFHNNGNKTFTNVSFLFDGNQIESFAVGDLNHDGFQDIYAGYGEIFNTPGVVPDVLWLNSGNSNKYFGLNLRGVQSNRNGAGAKIALYSALGVQVREVRSGESYGIQNSMQAHFGMGQAPAIDSVVIYWPSGTVDVLKQSLGLNQYITVQEGGCVVPQVTAIADGAAVFCSGDSVTIGVTDAFSSYQWSNGNTTPAITVQSSGIYAVTVTLAGGCTAVSNGVKVTVDPVEIPTVSVAGDTIICNGGEVMLTASPASAYTWSTGETTQSITVTGSGSYHVVAQGLCAAFASADIHVTVLDAPAPVPVNDTVPPNTPATLTATGGQIQWFDAPAGGSLLFEGNTFVTGPLGSSTTYWVSNTTVYDKPNGFVGINNLQGANIGDVQASGQIIFDCFTPFRLAKVLVSANVAAQRKIDLRNHAGETLQSKVVNIPAGASVISLDFDIPAGSDLVLTTDANVNLANLGSLGPQLRRTGQGVNYPYAIPNVVSLKNSNLGSNLYYYFYNWEVDYYGHECTSERIPVTAVVDPAIAASEPGWAAGLRLFPNPTGGLLRCELNDIAGGALSASVKNAQGSAVLTRLFSPVSGGTALEIDLSRLPKGVYWLELATGQGVAQRKVVLQ